MKDSFELKIGADGTIETIYQDGIEQFASEIGAEVSTVCRASNVEWEEVDHGLKGWTVRSAKNPEVALRWRIWTGEPAPESRPVVVSKDGDIVVFVSREAAIEEEIKHFWELKNG